MTKAVGAYIECNDLYLFGKRSDRGDAAGTWCIFGGKIEEGEDRGVALQREILEEAGVKIPSSIIEKAELLHVVSEEPMLTYYTYLIRVPVCFKPTLNNEHTEYAWMSVEEIAKAYPLHPKFGRTLKLLINDGTL